jgi:hypothetical protein
MATEGDAEERARRAFVHAVARERDAIEAHEQAALRHEEIAEKYESAALTSDAGGRDRLTQLASKERERAANARMRAEEVRNRLRADGLDL